MGLLLADRYHLDEPLGRGAMGEVWRATDQILDRPVAVKLLHTEEATDTERFRLEAQTAGRLNHPHVVGVYDFGSHHGQFYLVMELIDGWTLAQERSLRGTLSPAEAATVGAQMALGLSAAHAQGVVHRDIKPANVMLATDRTVKITDFGIARFADDSAATLTATGKVLGTADYLAPERALGRSAQPSSDIYSLGCVLYELLTGQPPFRGSNSLAVVQQHVDAPPVALTHVRPGIPGPLADYVLGMLAKDPAQRPTAEQAAAWLATPRYEQQPPATAQAQPAQPAPATPSRTGSRAGSRSGTRAGTRAGAGTRTGTRAVSTTRSGGTGSTGSTTRTGGDTGSGRRAAPRVRKRTGNATKAVLGGAGLLLFAAAAAFGASLNSSDETPASPSPAGSASVSGTPANGMPVNSTQPPTTPPAPPAAQEHAPERHEDGVEKSRSKHGGHEKAGRH
ncbi:serine/threonine protein kinase [Streptomyces sp. NBC_00820]|uniref:serine/threonine-protein kinase n=1 Tax=Streptomyces sp. NBC_00820 TaxID=2975842 RepID=UPI002ED67BEE|nr:serine/threonine protein kinase [Streptomyces sp. NBC_00820]